jgi:anti-anti-sigma regulatory factor
MRSALAEFRGTSDALTKLENNVNQTRVQTLMLKISVKDEESQKQLLLEIEGRLAGPWVEELERSWQAERQRTASQGILVRLAHVSFIDEAGKELLSRMFQAGAKLEGSGCMVRAIIARITGAAFSAHDCEDEAKKVVAAQSGGGQGNEHT